MTCLQNGYEAGSSGPDPAGQAGMSRVPMQQAPDIDVVGPLDIEDQVGMPPEAQVPQIGDLQLEGMARRAGTGMLHHQTVGLLEFIDQAMGHVRAGLPQIVIDDVPDILTRPFARDNRLRAHLEEKRSICARRSLK